ncbi:MAG TPA: hypothetical protein VF861_12785 [Telluria sp.]
MIGFSAEDPDGADARALLSELGQALAHLTGDSGAASFDAADVRGLRGSSWWRALALGYRALWLETRRVNLRAVGFYAAHGYRPVANYGKYVGRDDAVCLGKSLRENA